MEFSVKGVASGNHLQVTVQHDKRFADDLDDVFCLQQCFLGGDGLNTRGDVGKG